MKAPGDIFSNVAYKSEFIFSYGICFQNLLKGQPANTSSISPLLFINEKGIQTRRTLNRHMAQLST